MPLNLTPAERILGRIDVMADGCWLWAKSLNRDGYGVLRVDGVQWLAHRLSYKLFVGPIPEGAELDHTCRRRACVNPQHLEPVTHRENIVRGSHPNIVRHRKAICSKGHAVVGDNVSVRSDGRLLCRQCINARARNNRAIARNENPTQAV